MTDVIEKKKIAEDLYKAYVYGYPLVQHWVQRRSMTNTIKATDKKAPVNQFSHNSGLADKNSKEIVMLNMDTVYSNIMFDLKREPIYLKKPKADRYNSLELIDAYGDCIEILGTGFLGGNEEVEAVLVGPDYTGKLPDDLVIIKSSTNDVWGFIRILSKSNNNDDYKNIEKIQSGYEARPLSYRFKEYEQPDGIYEEEYDYVPFSKLNELSVEETFNIFNKHISDNPGKEYNQLILDKVSEYGIGAGKEFKIMKLPKEIRSDVFSFKERLHKEFEKIQNDMLIVNGWSITDNCIANFGDNYLLRAYIAWGGPGANPVEMAIYPSHLLKDGRDAKIHFQSAPPVRWDDGGFWSISIYGLDKFIIPNEIDRFGLNDRSDIEYNEDGSFDIYIQKSEPEGIRKKNWLPNEGKPSLIVLRLYLPSEQIIKGEWKNPDIIF